MFCASSFKFLIEEITNSVMCLLAAPWVQLSVSTGNGWPHNALWHHWLMPISCHFRDCKTLLVTSLTHVSGAIASVQNFWVSRPQLFWSKGEVAYIEKIEHFSTTSCIKISHVDIITRIFLGSRQLFKFVIITNAAKDNVYGHRIPLPGRCVPRLAEHTSQV